MEESVVKLIKQSVDLSDAELAKYILQQESEIGFGPGFDKEMFYGTEKLLNQAKLKVRELTENYHEIICTHEAVSRYRANKNLQNRIQAIAAIAGVVAHYREEFFGITGIAAAELTIRCYLDGLCGSC